MTESFGCLEDLADDRDYLAREILAAAPLPSSFSLRDKMSPVREQKSRGTCTAFATVAIAEYFNMIEYSNPNLDLSEEYLFKRAKQIDVEDYGYEGYGAYLRSVAKAITRYGTCLEETLPYNGTEPEDYWKKVSISQAMNKEASEYRTKIFAAVKGVDELRMSMVTTDSPILTGITLFENYKEARNNGGILPMPKGKKIGGHAMAAAEFDDSTELIGDKNSWGEHWGDKGYLKIPYEYYEKYSYTAWSFVDLENPALIEEKLIESQRKLVPEWALPSWDKAIKKGLVTKDTLPNKTITKAAYFVLKDRAGELD